MIFPFLQSLHFHMNVLAYVPMTTATIYSLNSTNHFLISIADKIGCDILCFDYDCVRCEKQLFRMTAISREDVDKNK